MSYETYKKMVKEDLKKAVESGQLSNEQYIAVIDTTLKDIAIIDDPNINRNIEMFIATIESKAKEMLAKSEEIGKEYKEMYAQLMKDL